jgi:putative ABC transport system permease protein
MPRRFLRGSVLRFLSTALALAAGVALVCAIDLVNRAVSAAFAEVLDTMAGRAGLQVTAGDGALVPEDLAATVGRVAGVALAVPVVDSWAFAADGTGEQIAVHGIDVGNDAAVRVYEPSDAAGPTMDDPLLFLAQRDSVIVTETYAAAHGLAIDDPLVLETPTGRKRFVVRGILAPRGIAKVQGGNLVAMDIAAAELAFTKPGRHLHRGQAAVAGEQTAPSRSMHSTRSTSTPASSARGDSSAVRATTPRAPSRPAAA